MHDLRSLRAVARNPQLGASALVSDDLIVAGTRLFLAASSLLIVFLVPSEPDHWVPLTYALLVLQTMYATALYLLRFFRTRAGAFIYDWGHWIDIAWYTALISLSSGTNSIFFFGYFFPIIVASFRWGFASGMRVALASALLFAGVGWVTRPIRTVIMCLSSAKIDGEPSHSVWSGLTGIQYTPSSVNRSM